MNKQIRMKLTFAFFAALALQVASPSAQAFWGDKPPVTAPSQSLVLKTVGPACDACSDLAVESLMKLGGVKAVWVSKKKDYFVIAVDASTKIDLDTVGLIMSRTGFHVKEGEFSPYEQGYWRKKVED